MGVLEKLRVPAEEVTSANDDSIQHPLALCKPRGSRVVIRRDLDTQKQTPGGLLLPDAFSKTKRQTGTVWSVGPGALVNGVLVPLDLHRGDRVIVAAWAGLEIKDPLSREGDLEEFVLVDEVDVVAVLPPV